jgi:UDP-glucose 4-epimerase
VSKCVLIVGGAGYIGSHMILQLKASGFQPLVLDNLITGHRDAVHDAELIVGDIANKTLLDNIFSTRHILAVMHFASYIEVGESVLDPGKYYQNNVANTLHLLQSMVQHHIRHIIFSSSAAVYGEPHYTPIDEAHVLAPVNPYGRSKLMVEQMLQDFSHAYGLNYIALRYFNAAGADPRGELGERHQHESHLIPLILQAASGKREAITLYGQDYPTPDGTCVRDYIHVQDLCEAHVLALQALLSGEVKSKAYNLGTGRGYSVRQVINLAAEVTQRPIPVKLGARRAGDPAVLVADPSFAMQELNWQPRYPEVEMMIKHAWQFAERVKVV